MWNEQDKSSVGYNEEMFGESPAAGREAAEQPRPRETTGAAQVLLERQIAPGERLLWSGRPQKLHGPRGAGRLFAVFFLGFACFWELMALQTLTLGAGPFGILFPLFGIPFILVGIKLLFPQVGGPRAGGDRIRHHRPAGAGGDQGAGEFLGAGFHPGCGEALLSGWDR